MLRMWVFTVFIETDSWLAISGRERLTALPSPPCQAWTHCRRQKSASDLEFSVAVGGSRCPRREEIVQRHGEITPGAALCIAVECAAVISEPGLFDR
jgi:hypothetical protein